MDNDSRIKCKNQLLIKNVQSCGNAISNKKKHKSILSLLNKANKLLINENREKNIDQRGNNERTDSLNKGHIHSQLINKIEILLKNAKYLNSPLHTKSVIFNNES